MTEYSFTIIIPVFNEIDNVGNIVDSVLDVLRKSRIEGEILVICTNSEDITKEYIMRLSQSHPNIHFITNDNSYTLPHLIAEGFGEAKSDIIQVFCTDYSYSVENLPDIYQAVKVEGYDVVIGSRYAKGGQILNRSLGLKIRSYGAVLFGRVMFPEITDPVSGFFAVKKDVIWGADLKYRGKILMEVLGKGRYNKYKEIPVIFKDCGEDKGSSGFSLVLDYIKQCTDIGFYAVRNHKSSVWKEWTKIIKFGFVGISGILVNTGLLYALTEYAGLFYMVSSIFAIEASIISNFILNDFWTFGGGFQSRIKQKWKRFISYQAVSVFGVVINIIVLFLLTEYAGLWYIFSNIAGIFVAFIWNFFVNRNFTWRKNLS